MTKRLAQEELKTHRKYIKLRRNGCGERFTEAQALRGNSARRPKGWDLNGCSSTTFESPFPSFVVSSCPMP